MQNPYEYLKHLVSTNTSELSRDKFLGKFAFDFGWRPSDILKTPSISSVATSHLIVEHGLENTAVISFINENKTYSELNFFESRSLLSISYNNLIDWHIGIEKDRATYIYNRTKTPTIVDARHFTIDSIDVLKSSTFEQIIGKRPNPNVLALDDALINTISYWRRELAAQLGSLDNQNMSALFNAILFARAIEDQNRLQTQFTGYALQDSLEAGANTIAEAIRVTLQRFNVYRIPDFLLKNDELRIFDGLDQYMVNDLFSQFYQNKFAPYIYDFSLISKHALSRIYEHYVSLLRLEDSGQQLSLFPALPQEEKNKSYGSIYTPQYIARFFAKFLSREIPLSKFKSLKIIDPAVGSGMFLRTLLEHQFEKHLVLSKDQVSNSIESVYGIDIDQNAVQATRLSLSLLNLALTNTLPDKLNIHTSEAIEYFQEHEELREYFDVVVANPPFVALDIQSLETRENVSNFMKGITTGRLDLYLAFLKLSLELLKPGAYGCFVLPHSFLLNDSSAGIRKLLSQQTYIKCVADLSAIRVFEDTGIYVILLIFQKRPLIEPSSLPHATIIKCQELVGQALQDAIEEQNQENSLYTIYTMPQTLFEKQNWLLVPPTARTIQHKIEATTKLSDFMEIREGFVSGADSIFIIENRFVPKGEEALYVPYLSDREMRAYSVPNTTKSSVFYPYIGNQKISEIELRSGFPKTWQYLENYRVPLTSRSPVQKNNLKWWEPTRPRVPENMMRPKIVTPHLVFVPKFSLDLEGQYAISRSPFLYFKESAAEDDLVLLFTGLLNSAPFFWHLSNQSHRFSGGYLRLEVGTLKQTYLPDPSKISLLLIREIIDLVRQRMNITDHESLKIELAIDKIASDLYGLSQHERKAIGIE